MAYAHSGLRSTRSKATKEETSLKMTATVGFDSPAIKPIHGTILARRHGQSYQQPSNSDQLSRIIFSEHLSSTATNFVISPRCVDETDDDSLKIER